jgi:hypothetical protein
MKETDVRWTCQCGVSAWMSPKHSSLAGQVMQARTEHASNCPCGDPDIEQLETRKDFDRRLYESRFHAGVF